MQGYVFAAVQALTQMAQAGMFAGAFAAAVDGSVVVGAVIGASVHGVAFGTGRNSCSP